MSESSTNDQTRNEGEGNRTADRQYREGVRRHVASGASAGAAEQAQQAQQALEGAEAEELRKAEESAKAGRKP